MDTFFFRVVNVQWLFFPAENKGSRYNVICVNLGNDRENYCKFKRKTPSMINKPFILNNCAFECICHASLVYWTTMK